MTTQTSPRPAPQAPVPRPVGAPPPAKPAPPTAPRPSRLGAVKRERLREALRHMFYGPPGIGKTSLLVDIEGLLLIDIEGGSLEIEATRYPFRLNPDGTVAPGGYVPESYEDVLGALDDLIANPDHAHLALGIDGFSKLEALIHAHICKRDQKKNVEGYGYGKGYKVALVEWRLLMAKLDILRARGMQIVLAGHSVSRTFKNPDGPDYDRYWPLLNGEASGELVGWCDVVGFVHFEEGGAQLAGDESQAKRARHWGTDRRLIELTHGVWEAKCRLSLPDQIDLAREHPWRPFADAKIGARGATVETLTAEVAAEIDRITGGDRAREFTTSAGKTTTGAALLALPDLDAATLGRILHGLKSTASVNTAATQES
jgi:hypothetical protein